MLLRVVMLACLSGSQQEVPTSAAVLALARSGASAQLALLTREHTDTVREAFTQSLRLSVSASGATVQQMHLESAWVLARVYATTWRDSFLVRETARFERAPRAAKLARVKADSLRRAGNHALSRVGVPTAMRLWRASLRQARAARDSAGQAMIFGNLGAGFYRAGEADSAERYLTRSRRMAVALGDHRTTANAVGMLASVHWDRGELAEAAELYAAASALRERSGDSRGMAADQNNLGLVARELGDLAAAVEAFERALALNIGGARDGARAVNLVNLAGVASLIGEYARADRQYGEALALQRRSEDAADAAFTLHERARLRIRRGDYAGAAAELRAALKAHRAAGADVDAALAGADLAAVLMAQGDPQAAATELRQAERAARDAQAPEDVAAEMALVHAELAIELNAYQEAKEHYDRAEALYGSLRDDFGLGRVADGRALLLHRRKDYAGALRALETAARAYARAGDARSTALAKLSMAYTQLELPDTSGARLSMTQAARAFRELGDPIGEAGALHAFGELALARRAPVAAETFYRQGLEKLGDRQAADLRWRLFAGLGAALRDQRAHGGEVLALRDAVREIERSALTLHSQERRAGYLADKYAVYAELALAEHARGDVASAFAASERVRAQHMLALLGRGRLSGRRPLLAQESDLRRQIAQLMEELERPASAQAAREFSAESKPQVAVREALLDAQTRYARLLAELREREPGYAALVAPTAAPASAVARQLRRDEVMIEYLVTDSTTLAFVIADGTTSVVDLDLPRRNLAPLVDFAVRVTQRLDRSLAGNLWQAPLSRLFDHLIRPIEATGRLKGKHSLIIVPHAELHYLPFAALVDPVRRTFLVESWHLTYAPSASVWLRLRQATYRRSPGVLALAPRPDVLPFSREEVNGIKRIYGRDATTLVGADASEKALLAGLARAGVVHLATLGVLNKHNPLFSFIELAGSGARRERLEAHEVFELPLSGQLIVLSACQTGLASGALADVPAGDDWVGLMQAFLSAGAGGVVASLWPVSDRATASLMTRFHTGLKGGPGDAAALADAQRAAIRQPATSHPYYWAAFTLHSGQR